MSDQCFAYPLGIEPSWISTGSRPGSAWLFHIVINKYCRPLTKFCPPRENDCTYIYETHYDLHTLRSGELTSSAIIREVEENGEGKAEGVTILVLCSLPSHQCELHIFQGLVWYLLWCVFLAVSLLACSTLSRRSLGEWNISEWGSALNWIGGSVREYTWDLVMV